MNAEKVYAAATAALKIVISDMYDSITSAQKCFDMVMNNPENEALPALSILGKLAREAKEEMVSKGGKKDVLAACKAIVKSAQGQCRDNLKGAFIDKEGYQCLCDGFRAVRLKDHLDALPTAEGIDLERIFKPCREYSVEMKLPTIGEVKAFIASEKAAGKKEFRYDFGEGKPAVDAKYLLDLLKLGLDETAKIHSRYQMTYAIYMHGEGVEAILMPVRKGD